MKYFLIAGEASGDLHASGLMQGILKYDQAAEFRYMGGACMNAVAGGIIMHYSDTNFMMLEVLLHLGKIFRNFRKIQRAIRTWNPDVVIPVDYPGFNLRMARYARAAGFRVCYFITPKVWAWRERRINKLRRDVHRMVVILPFEVEYYRSHGISTEYFGNPLVDRTEQFSQEFRGTEDWKRKHGWDRKPLVALVPGSRFREIESMLPVMVRVAGHFPDYRFVVAGAPSIPSGYYAKFLAGSGVEIVHGETYDLMKSARAGLVTSGTATLEAALMEMPQTVLYRTGKITALLAKQLIKTNFISLVNLIFGSQLVSEILQKDLYGRATRELGRILDEPGYSGRILKGYGEIRKKLGKPGVTDRIARDMVNWLKSPVA